MYQVIEGIKSYIAYVQNDFIYDFLHRLDVFIVFVLTFTIVFLIVNKLLRSK